MQWKITATSLTFKSGPTARGCRSVVQWHPVDVPARIGPELPGYLIQGVARMNLILFLIIGGVAGWLAGLIMKGRGFGVLANIGIGIVGSFVGGFLFRILQLTPEGRIGELVTATVGAVLLLAVVGAIKKA